MNTLISSLKTNYVIIIENDFGYVDNVENIVGLYCGLPVYNRQRIQTSLAGISHSMLSDTLENIRSRFSQIEHNLTLQETLLPEHFGQYLVEVNQIDIFPDDTRKYIQGCVDGPDGERIKEIFFRNGILTVHEAYTELLKALKSNGEIGFAYYKARPVPVDLQAFAADLLHGIHETQSLFYIAIVDKMLGEGSDESGKEFIRTDLIGINREHSLKNLSLIFTTQAQSSLPESYESFFVREIQKDSQDVIKQIGGFLADCAYATVFNSLSESYKNNVDKALELALRNQKNIKHVTFESIKEGTSIYDSIKNWFDLVIQNKIEISNLRDLEYNAGLTHFFEEDYISDRNDLAEYGKDLELLNSYEVFDNHVNEKFLPIFPGDIFEKGGDYYILMGQGCDVLLRKNGKRGAKIAEFLKINLKPFKEGNQKKFQVNVDNKGTKEILIQHFYNKTADDYKVASIEITSKNTYYGDYSVLDLCFYNKDGVAKVNTTDIVQRVFTKDQIEYLKHLYEYFRGLKNYLDVYPRSLDLDSNNICSAAIFQNNEEKNIVFDIKRVCRLKGRFYDSIFQQLISYKARIDLNLIENAIETSKVVNLCLKYKFLPDEEFITATLFQLKGQQPYFEANEIKEKSSDQFKSVLENYSIFSTTSAQTTDYSIEIVTADEPYYKLELMLRYIDRGNKKQKQVTDDPLKINRILGKKLDSLDFTYLDANETAQFNQEGEVHIHDIARGIRINETNQIVNIENGEIKVSE